MDGVRRSPARYRAPEAVPLPSGTRAEGAPGPVERPIPVASSILWMPAVAHAARDIAYPIFITRRALTTVHDHVVATSQGAAALGFLAGAVCRCPESGIGYIVIESTIPLPWSISGDRLQPALQQGRATAQDVAQKTGTQLLGWYRSHTDADPRPSALDLDTHLTCFDEPWQVALVVAPGEKPAGGIFRISRDAASSRELLPFYELLDEASLLADGRKVTDLAWATYCTEEAILSSDPASAPALQRGSRLLYPEEFEQGRAAGRRRRWPLRPGVRFLGRGAFGVLVALALFGVYRVLASGPAGRAPPAARVVTARALWDRVDRLADSVALAVSAFDVRAGLFEARRMACDDLARGLVAVEERWTAYNGAWKRLGASFDSAHHARDRALYSAVDAADRRFERSKCPRP
jgi:proteasome lid subunit RPN8/RPN11